MDPICPYCEHKVDSRSDFNVEEISGGAGDKGYKIAVIYCEHCRKVLGVIPGKSMLG